MDFLIKILEWLDTSLVYNWLGIPIAAGLLFGPMNLFDAGYAEISKAATTASTFKLTGTLKYSGRRNRYLVLVTSEKRRSVSCGSASGAASCVYGYDLPKKVTIEAFEFDGGAVILSMADKNGQILVTEASQRSRLAETAHFAEQNTYSDSFSFAAFIGLVIAIIRYPLFVWPRRRKRRLAASKTA